MRKTSTLLGSSDTIHTSLFPDAAPINETAILLNYIFLMEQQRVKVQEQKDSSIASKARAALNLGKKGKPSRKTLTWQEIEKRKPEILASQHKQALKIAEEQRKLEEKKAKIFTKTQSLQQQNLKFSSDLSSKSSGKELVFTNQEMQKLQEQLRKDNYSQKIEFPWLEAKKKWEEESKKNKLREGQKTVTSDELKNYIQSQKLSNPDSIIDLAQSPYKDCRLVVDSVFYGPEVLNFLPESVINVANEFDFSNVDLSSLNIDGIVFANSTFKNATLPSTNFASFEGSCDLEESKWSKTKQNGVFFGNPYYEFYAMNQAGFISHFQSLLEQNPTATEDLLRLSQAIKSVEEYLNLESNKTLKVTDANFTETEFAGFLSHHSNFEGANFENSTIKSKSSTDEFFFYPREVKNLDLTGTNFQVLSYLDEIVSEYKTMKKLDIKQTLTRVENLIGNGGFVPQEVIDKIAQNQQIVVKLNAGNTTQKFLEEATALISYDQEVGIIKTDLTQESVNFIEKTAIEVCSQNFGNYNYKFVGSDSEEEADLEIGIMVQKDSRGGVSSEIGFYNMSGGSRFVIVGDEAIDSNPFSILSHEIGHLLLFSHPMGFFEGLTTMDYKSPTAVKVDEDGKLVANNILELQGFGPDDHYATKLWMDALGRATVQRVNDNILTALGNETKGIQVSYNPYPQISNVIEFAPEILSKDFEVIVMDASQALRHCKSVDISNCDPIDTIEGKPAIVLFSKTTGLTQAVVILDGKNPQIKIGEKLQDVKIQKGSFYFLEEQNQLNTAATTTANSVSMGEQPTSSSFATTTQQVSFESSSSDLASSTTLGEQVSSSDLAGVATFALSEYSITPSSQIKSSSELSSSITSKPFGSLQKSSAASETTSSNAESKASSQITSSVLSFVVGATSQNIDDLKTFSQALTAQISSIRQGATSSIITTSPASPVVGYSSTTADSVVKEQNKESAISSVSVARSDDEKTIKFGLEFKAAETTISSNQNTTKVIVARNESDKNPSILPISTGSDSLDIFLVTLLSVASGIFIAGAGYAFNKQRKRLTNNDENPANAESTSENTSQVIETTGSVALDDIETEIGAGVRSVEIIQENRITSANLISASTGPKPIEIEPVLTRSTRGKNL